MHDKELADLRALIAQLLMQLEHLQQQRDSAPSPELHVARLREANEHLVLATFNAQFVDVAAVAPPVARH